MRIIVCIKEITEYVPGWQVTSRSMPHGILARVNPQDLIALEEALILRERLGGEVIALSFSGDEKALRRALTSGADRAILVEDTNQNQRDWHTTSFILAQAASRIGFDLILCGTWRLDTMDGTVGPGIAEHLGIPVIAGAVKVEVFDENTGTLRLCRRLPKGMRETCEVCLPCVVTVEEGLNEPRYIPISGRYYRQGLTKPVEHVTLLELGITPEALLPKTIILEMSELRPRTRLGVRVTSLSLEEKMKLLMGISKTAGKRELLIHEPQKAAHKLLEKFSEWLSEKSG